MKFLVFTDTHENMKSLAKVKKKAKNVDFILCGGDFTIFGHAMQKMLKAINELGKPVYTLHGNHEVAEDVEKRVKKFKNITFLHKTIITINDIAIIAYGGGGFSKTFPNFNTFINEAKKKTKGYEKKIVITHAPPYKTQLDRVHGSNVGNESVTKLIKTIAPQYAFAGHIHECEHNRQKLQSSIIINPGPDGEEFEL